MPPPEGGSGKEWQKSHSLSHLCTTMKYCKQSGHAEITQSAERGRGSIIRDLFMMRSVLPNVAGTSHADSAVRLRPDFFEMDGSENNDGVPLSFFIRLFFFSFFLSS